MNPSLQQPLPNALAKIMEAKLQIDKFGFRLVKVTLPVSNHKEKYLWDKCGFPLAEATTGYNCSPSGRSRDAGEECGESSHASTHHHSHSRSPSRTLFDPPDWAKKLLKQQQGTQLSLNGFRES